MKKVMIFGSTGSIGRNTLDIIRQTEGKFKVLGLSTNSDTLTLKEQAKQFNPAYICIADEKKAQGLENKISSQTKIFKGKTGLEEFASIGCDIAVMAISGISCLRPLLISLRSAKRIALANKESVVTAANFLFRQAKSFNTEIIPVDSEINALYQLLEKQKDFEKVYLTASGGPLLNYKKKDLTKVGAREVLSHPTWRMGKRITVDSATLVNKGFEVIETHYFFSLAYESISVIVHRESAVHALLQQRDKSLIACIYPADMRIPIAFALYYPQRQGFYEGVNFAKSFSLSFEPLQQSNFPLFELIIAAAKRKDNCLAILNACDEVAIDYFLKGKIKFTDIHKVMQYLFERYKHFKLNTVEDIFYWDNWARRRTHSYLEGLC